MAPQSRRSRSRRTEAGALATRRRAPTPPEAQTQAEGTKAAASLPRSSLTAMLRGTTVTRGTQQQERAWERKAGAGADAARLEAEVLTLRRDKARSDAELERHRRARGRAGRVPGGAERARRVCAELKLWLCGRLIVCRPRSRLCGGEAKGGAAPERARSARRDRDFGVLLK